MRTVQSESWEQRPARSDHPLDGKSSPALEPPLLVGSATHIRGWYHSTSGAVYRYEFPGLTESRLPMGGGCSLDSCIQTTTTTESPQLILIQKHSRAHLQMSLGLPLALLVRLLLLLYLMSHLALSLFYSRSRWKLWITPGLSFCSFALLKYTYSRKSNKQLSSLIIHFESLSICKHILEI